ncbi:leucine-rich repeat-containing protein 74A [Strongylocentrotus purpuratus]|uniref:EF-hand domain-containing protein n=1 Tax=Strongylocentrotus purpuratus TaxID=7668 RepID=A0A7M7HMS3_STRPU|nr:leucine-rich repeat-containing protein 74A [Strongylocentrotus purpuratus]
MEVSEQEAGGDLRNEIPEHEQALLNGDHHHNGDDVDGHHNVNDERPVTVGEQVRQESDSAGGAPVLATAHLTMDQSKDFGGGGDESGVGSVTDSSSVASKRNKMGKDDDSDHSDSGWDTDLEIDEKDKIEEYDPTGRKTYKQACLDIGVVPASHFLRHMTTSRVSMKHHGLGPHGAKAIAVALVANTTVLTLDLEDNWVEGDGGVYIADMLKENCYINDLNLAENKIGSRGAKAMGEMLLDNTNLRRVNLSGNEFKDKDANEFTESFKSNYRIKELILSHNEFGEVGGEILGHGIGATESIEHLNLSWNHLRRKGAIAICRGLAENLSIKRLNLSWNGFGNEGALAMAEALKFNSTLQWLDMSNNRVTNEGAFMLAKGVEINDSIKVLKLGQNPITAAGAMAILIAIKNNSNTVLELLDLADITVNKDCVKLLTELKEVRPEFLVAYQSSVGQFEKPPEKEPDPVKMLREFISANNLRVWDLFKTYDKDKSLTVTREEFKKGLVSSGLQMKPHLLNRLVETLDKDGDGEIDYGELKIGHNEMIQAERDERKRQMERVQKNRSNPLYKPVAEQFQDLKPKQVRDSLSPDRLQKLRSTIKPDTTQWTSRGRKADTVSAGIRSLDATVNFTSELEEKYMNEEQWLSKTLGPASRTPSPGGLSTRAPGSRAKSPRSKTPMKSPRTNNLNTTL